ncbi:MAG: hypothetical protein FWG13_06040 [Leptospirales bacterium]|nr:hypothetical protein [Leptospirales bacterium]
MENFNYRERFVKSYCLPPIMFAILAVIAAVTGYGLRVRSVTIVPYPYSLLLFILCATGFAVYAYYKYDRARKSAANPNPIILTNDSLSLPQGADEKAVINISAITAIEGKNSDEGRRLKLQTYAKRYDVFEGRFDSPEEFARFEKTLRDIVK